MRVGPEICLRLSLNGRSSPAIKDEGGARNHSASGEYAYRLRAAPTSPKLSAPGGAREEELNAIAGMKPVGSGG